MIWRFAADSVLLECCQIRNESGDLTTNLTEIERNIREYYEYLYVNKLGNLDEMDKFIETHKLPN